MSKLVLAYQSGSASKTATMWATALLWLWGIFDGLVGLYFSLIAFMQTFHTGKAIPLWVIFFSFGLAMLAASVQNIRFAVHIYQRTAAAAKEAFLMLRIIQWIWGGIILMVIVSISMKLNVNHLNDVLAALVGIGFLMFFFIPMLVTGRVLRAAISENEVRSIAGI